MNILVGVTGGIAAYKALELVSILKKRGHDVRVVMTPAAARFVAPLSFQTISRSPVGLDTFAENVPHEVQHIAWADWADLFVVAPASANTLAKMAAGIADNLLTTIVLAADCPVYAVPAMNTRMLRHPATAANLETLRARGVHIMEPASGLLACGVQGPGRLPEPPAIADFLLGSSAFLAGKRVLVTAGPTSEPIDPVRAITNRSSGRMGYALAQAAADAGAAVTLISGPVSLDAPHNVSRISVRTAQEMYEAVMEQAQGMDIVIACAAVSDYAPVQAAQNKIKKHDEELTIVLKRTKDILARLGADKHYYLVGFAAETTNVPDYAREKLRRKNLDMIVANDVSDPSIGFESPENAVTIFTSSGKETTLPKAPKPVIAAQILTLIARELKAGE